eukprot:jgi/Tetstr1/422046/TSEL_012910.t1
MGHLALSRDNFIEFIGVCYRAYLRKNGIGRCADAATGIPFGRDAQDFRLQQGDAVGQFLFGQAGQVFAKHDRRRERTSLEAAMSSTERMMTAIGFKSPGGPDVLAAESRPVPSPREGQVLIAVAAAGVNRPDVLQRKGAYPPPPGVTDIPGLEVAGTIAGVGPKVDGLAEGDAGVRAAPGESFLVHGGTSGIGTTAIQLAKAFGATVFTTVGSEEKAQAARALGADHVIDYNRQDFVSEILEITDKRGVDVILDMVGGDYVERNWKVAAVEGRICQIATLNG